jgi:uncharacterized OsmC-like protein
VSFSWTVRVRTDSSQVAHVHARNHTFRLASAASFRPTDDFPSSLEALLGALGADLSNTFFSIARRRRITVYDLEFSATCTLKNELVHLGVVGEEGSPAIERIDAALYASVDADEDQAQETWRETLMRSPLYNTLKEATELNLRFALT